MKPLRSLLRTASTRIARRLALAAVAAAGLLLAALGSDLAQIRLGWLLLVAASLVFFLQGRVARWRPPRLHPDADRFRFFLPASLLRLAGALVIVLLAAGWAMLVWPQIPGLWHQEGFSFITASLMALILLIMLIPCLLAAWLAAMLLRATPWAVRGDGNQFTIHYIGRSVSIPLENLTAWRFSAGPGAPTDALHFPDVSRGLTLPAGRLSAAQSLLLTQLVIWLQARGAAITDARPLVKTSAWRLNTSLGLLGIAELICWLAPFILVQAACFWGIWFRTGTYNLVLIGLTLPLAFFLAAALHFSPLYGWLGRLLTGAWLAGPTPPERHRITIIDEPAAGAGFAYSSRSALLSATGDALRLTVGQAEMEIPKEAILKLDALGPLASLLRLGQVGYRLFCRPVRLAWRAERDGRPIVHTLLLTSRAGLTNARERRLDRALFQRLTAWRHGDAPLDLSNLKTSTARPGALAAALFIAASLGLAFLHNHLILNQVRTGALSPPRTGRTLADLQPHLLTADPSTSASLMIYFNPDYSGNRPQAPILYWKDPAPNRLRPLRCGFSFTHFSIPAFPGPLTHLACSGEDALGICLIPPRSRHLQSLFPPQVVDLRTGRGRDLRSLTSLDVKFGPDPTLALYGGERLFYATSPSTFGALTPSPSTETEIGWIDVPRDTRHPIGKLKDLAAEHYHAPLFFPGGRQVLFAGHVIDLATGRARPLQPPPPTGFSITNQFPPAINAATSGSRLLWHTRLVPSPTTLGAPAAPERKETWDIDPSSARLRILPPSP